MEIKRHYRQIDVSTWKRREHYDVFGRGVYPYIGITTTVDVSQLLKKCRGGEWKFFTAFMYVVMRAMNGIENFRYRVFEDQVVLIDVIDPSFNVMDKETELFFFAYAPYDEDYAAFNTGVEKAKDLAIRTRSLASNRVDVVYISCLPWFGFTDIIQPMGLTANDSIPRLIWGKYEGDTDGKITLPFSITGHHGLFDGLHVSKLLDAMGELLNNPVFLDDKNG